MATVVNINRKSLQSMGYNSLDQWLKNPRHLYIGRDMTHCIKGAVGSKWANPFSVKTYGREQCIKLYIEYIENNKQLKQDILELDGKVLGCWCKPDGCHGDILVDMLRKKKESDNFSLTHSNFPALG